MARGELSTVLYGSKIAFAFGQAAINRADDTQDVDRQEREWTAEFPDDLARDQLREGTRSSRGTGAPLLLRFCHRLQVRLAISPNPAP
jgi:hypothetical protein